MQSITSNIMKTHCFETSAYRTGRPDYPTYHPDPPVRGGRLPVNASRGHLISEPALRSALELRYQVYCVECSFLCPDDYPDGTESDEHDDAGQHFFAYDPQDKLVGYVRLIRPDAEQRLPFQNHCKTFAGGVSPPLPGRAAEISRLMLRSDYRRLSSRGRGAVASGQPHAANAGDRRDQAAQVLLALYRQVYLYSRAHGIDHWYAAMERPLARSLLRMNIAFKEIGPLTDYYGPVAPYFANLHEVESQVAASNPALLAWLQQPKSDRDCAGFRQKPEFTPMRACG